MASVGTLEVVAREVGLALQPLADALAGGSVQGFLGRLGLGLPDGVAGDAQFAAAASAAANAVTGLVPLVTALVNAIEAGDEGNIVSSGAQVVAQIGQIAADFVQFGNALNTVIGSAAGLTAAQKAALQALAQELPGRLLGYALIEYVRGKSAGLVAFLNLIGLVDDTVTVGSGIDPTAPPYRTEVLRFDRLGNIISNPGQAYSDLYGWATPGFDGRELLERVQGMFEALHQKAQLVVAPGQPLILEAFLLRFAVDPTASPPGVTMRLRTAATQDVSTNAPLTDLWSLTLGASARFDAGLEAEITPPLHAALAPPTGTANVQATFGLTAQNADASPVVVFGQTGGSVLQGTSFSFGAGFGATWDVASGKASADPVARFKVTGGKLVIDLSDSDSFISSLVPGGPIESDFDLTVSWSLDGGVHVSGGAQLELTLPLAIDLGPIHISEAYLDIGLSGGDIALALSVAFGATLGPIEVSVDHIGFQGLIGFPAGGGNLGPANLTIGFKPPDGLGIAIDAGVVSGGGYISFDPTKGQYAGVLDVNLADIVAVKVIGVLDTKLPDGSSGYSFLLIITFDLPPIQLSFGFTLNGVGGLGGVNRTMVLDALRAGLRAHTLDDILFPPDPIANAPKIISDIESFFPPQQGRYLFGPMVQIGWGEVNLLTFSVGIILEVPDPVRLAILGEVKVAIPTSDLALIEMNIDVLGTIDFGLGKIAIDGTMYDSHVLAFQLGGDMAFRLGWGSNPEFLVSFGGFNPTFTPPPDVPQLARLSISLGSGSNPRLSAQSYFAVTSNTLQFGANVELYASAAGFSVHGWVGFDALFQFSPFAFEIDFSAGFDISFEGASLCGIQLDASLSGVTPWHLHGDASFHILFFSVSASIDLTWGDTQQTALPAQPVLPPLVAALGDPRNWSVVLPASTDQLVTLRTIAADPTSIVVHPLGSLSVRETIVPLDTAITKFNGVTPADGNEFHIDAVTLDGDPASTTSHREYFAVAQFTDMSDADKLSAPSYEQFDAGVALGTEPVSTGNDTARTVEYQERYIDDFTALSRFGQIYTMPASVHAVLALSGLAARVPGAVTGLRTYGTPYMSSPITIANMGYAVVGTADLVQRADILAGTVTRFEAVSALNAYLAANPTARGTVQVVTAYELAA